MTAARGVPVILLVSLWILRGDAWAKPSPARLSQRKTLVGRLSEIRKQVASLEQGLIEESHGRENAKSQLKKIRQLLKLQKEERVLGEKRKAELERTVDELELRQKSRTKNYPFKGSEFESP